MEFAEAKTLIRMHAGREDGPKMATGFLGCLRPYAGLNGENFEDVVEATAEALLFGEPRTEVV